MYRKLSRVFRRDAEALWLIQNAISGSQKTVESIQELKKTLTSLGQGRELLLSSCFDDMKPGIIVNMIRNKKERNVAKVIHDVSEKYLDISPEYLGFVDYDPLLEKSINKMEAFFMAGKSDSTNMQAYDIAMKILKRTPKETLKYTHQTLFKGREELPSSTPSKQPMPKRSIANVLSNEKGL